VGGGCLHHLQTARGELIRIVNEPRAGEGVLLVDSPGVPALKRRDCLGDQALSSRGFGLVGALADPVRPAVVLALAPACVNGFDLGIAVFLARFL